MGRYDREAETGRDRDRDRGRPSDDGKRDWNRRDGDSGGRFRDNDDFDRRRRGGGGGGGGGGRRRSRSRSVNRESFVRRRADISTSRERSREREKRRRKQQAECIRRAGGFRKLADSEGKEPVRLFWDGFQWVAKTGASSALLADPLLVNSTRKLRRIYFGNLPLHLGLTETNFQHIIFQEMRKRGLCNNPDENPVLCVWFAKDKGNYGFVEFASVEETERALTLDGMDCLGVPVKVSRPNDYCSAPGQGGPGAPSMLGPAAPIAPVSAAPGVLLGTPASETSELVNSKCIRFKEIIKPTDLENGQDINEYLEALQDVVEGCEDCGHVVTSVILHHANIGSLAFTIGDVFLEFETKTAADTCVALMSQRKYFDRPVLASKLLDRVFYSTVKPLSQTKTSPPSTNMPSAPPGPPATDVK